MKSCFILLLALCGCVMVAAQQDYLYRDSYPSRYGYRPVTPISAARRAMYVEVDDADTDADRVDPTTMLSRYRDVEPYADYDYDYTDIDPYWAQQLREPVQTMPSPMQPGVQPEVQQPTLPTVEELDSELSSAIQYKNQLVNMRSKLSQGINDAQQLGLPQGMKVPTINEINQEEAKVNEYINLLNQMKEKIAAQPQIRLQQPGVVQHRQPFQQRPSMTVPQRLAYPGARTRVQPSWTRDIADIDVLDRSMMEPSKTAFQTNIPGGFGWRHRWGWGFPGFGFGGFGWPWFGGFGFPGFGFGFPGFGFGFGFPFGGFGFHRRWGWW